MAYSTLEVSRNDGQPVELFDFVLGTSHFRYTSSDVAYTLGIDTYAPLAIARQGAKTSQNLDDAAVEITVPRDCSVVAAIRGGLTSSPVRLRVYREHRGDGDFVVAFDGTLRSNTNKGASEILRVESMIAALRTVGPRRKYSRNCSHVLYSLSCGLDKNLYGTAAVVDAVNGLAVTINALAATADEYRGGLLRWSSPWGDYEYAWIDNHSGAVLTLAWPLPSLVPGTAVTVFLGCPHTLAVCDSRFGNSLRFGGQPWIPDKNPFNGTTLF